MSGCVSQRTAICATVYALAGKHGEAEKTVEAYLRTPAPDPWMLAGYYWALGDKNKTFTWLTEAYEQRSANLCLLKIAPEFAGLRTDPRFQDLLRRMNFRRSAALRGTAILAVRRHGRDARATYRMNFPP